VEELFWVHLVYQNLKKIGFSASTADSRIRKYEGDLMAPKSEIRNKLVQALDVDPSALSDIDIHSIEDVVRTFFFMEEYLGFEIESFNSDQLSLFNKEKTSLNGIFLLSTAICISGMNKKRIFSTSKMIIKKIQIKNMNYGNQDFQGIFILTGIAL
jgi:hypothetical protein